MGIQDIKRELIRQFQEMRQFKLNLAFANFSILVMMMSYLSYFDGREEKPVLFFLLFTWYFATHSITHPAFFVEDEILDRTIISVIQSKKSVIQVLLLKIIVQVLTDAVKALPLFTLIYLGVGIHFSLLRGIAILGVCLFVVLGLYGFGLLLSGFCLIFSRTSNIAGLISYFILFFAGILPIEKIEGITLLSYLFPFAVLKEWLKEPQLGLLLMLAGYAVVYWIAGILFFRLMDFYSRKKGNLFHV